MRLDRPPSRSFGKIAKTGIFAALWAISAANLAAWIAVGAAVADPARNPLTQREKKSKPAQSRATAELAAVGIRFDTKAGETRLLVDLDGVPSPVIFLVANPPRVIIDVPGLVFRLPAEPPGRPAGLVKAFRYGLFAPGQSRIVLDTNGPVKISRAEIQKAPADARQAWVSQLVVAILPSDEAGFLATVAEHRPPAPPLKSGSYDDVNDAEQPPKPRPVVVIDPGHGGIDPGAVGHDNVLEKSIVLAVAQRLKAELAKAGRYDIVMTRSTDVFVALEQRVQIAGEARADLFVSIHADSAGAIASGGNLRGATIYTLAERASDEVARRLAEKENAVDILAGLKTNDADDDDQVRDILIDLLRRETANFSTDFRKIAIGELRNRIALSRDPNRSAAFKVLKQAKTPSVLIELGYMSNAQDQALMTTGDWQKKVAKGLGAAIETYFSRRLAGGG